MGKRIQYSEDSLLGAVIKYMDSIDETKIIKVSELVQWTNANIPELYGVCDKDFLRKRQVKNKNGEIEYFDRICKLRIDEENERRRVSKAGRANVVFSSRSQDEFFRLADVEKRKALLAAKESYDKLISMNAYLARQNNEIKKKNKVLEEQSKAISDKLFNLSKQINKIEKEINCVYKHIEEKGARLQLEEIGLVDGKIDIRKYRDSLQLASEDILNISAIINLDRQLMEQDPVQNATNQLLERLGLSD